MSGVDKKSLSEIDICDLFKELSIPLAVIEAKDNHHTIGQGLQQALGYAEILDVPSAFSSNGDAFASHNKVDALMALCDRLERCLTATAATRRRLLDALLAEALAPEGKRELEAAE